MHGMIATTMITANKATELVATVYPMVEKLQVRLQMMRLRKPNAPSAEFHSTRDAQNSSGIALVS